MLSLHPYPDRASQDLRTMRKETKQRKNCLPVFVVEVALVKLPNKLTELLLHGLEVNLILVLLVFPGEIVREEDAWVIKTFHYAKSNAMLPSVPVTLCDDSLAPKSPAKSDFSSAAASDYYYFFYC